jgi:hypothetical protein
MHYVATDGFCKLKTVYSMYFSKFFEVWVPFYSGYFLYPDPQLTINLYYSTRRSLASLADTKS